MTFFSDDQIERLQAICDEPDFILGAEDILIRARFLVEKNRKPSSVRKELRQFMKVLDKLSLDASVAISAADPFRHYSDRTTLHRWRQVVERSFDKVTGSDSAFLRAKVGEFAKLLFDEFGLTADSSSAGDFVDFLTIIKKASGAKFSPRDLARDTLK